MHVLAAYCGLYQDTHPLKTTTHWTWTFMTTINQPLISPSGRWFSRRGHSFGFGHLWNEHITSSHSNMCPGLVSGQNQPWPLSGERQEVCDSVDSPWSFWPINHGILMDQFCGWGDQGTVIRWFWSYLQGTRWHWDSESIEEWTVPNGFI